MAVSVHSPAPPSGSISGPHPRGLRLDAFFLCRRARILAASASFAAGIGTSIGFGLSQLGAFVGLGLLACLLATTLALGKSTTACGLNVLAYLAPSAGSRVARIRGAVTYLAASAMTAGAIGLGLNFAGTIFGANRLAFAAVPLLGFFGLVELGIIRIPFVVSGRWQVPVAWVRGKRGAPLIWGILLGSGLATWMPFPTYFGLLVLSALAPFPLGAALLALYGVARAMPALGTVPVDSGLVDRINRQMWELRLATHAAAGCLTLALCGGVAGVHPWST